MDNLGLLNALMISSEAHWNNLWLAVLFQRHTVVSSTSSGAFYYVVSSRPHSISLLKLRPTDDDHLWTMRPCSDDLLMWETVDTMESYRCHEYTLELKHGTRGPTVAVRVKSVGGESLKRFCCMHFLENFPLYVLKALANAVGLVLPRTAKHIRYAEALLDHCEIDGNAKDDVMSRVDKKLAKRSKRKSKAAASSDGAEEDAVGGEDANESAKEEVVLDNPFVRSLPEAEVAFAFSEIPAGHALDDEEATRDWTRSQQLPRRRQRQKRRLRQQRRLRRLPAVVRLLGARVRRHLACCLRATYHHWLLLLPARLRRHLPCRLRATYHHWLLLLRARCRHLASHLCLLRATYHNRLLLQLPLWLYRYRLLLQWPLWLHMCACQTLGRKMHHQGAHQFACTQGPKG